MSAPTKKALCEQLRLAADALLCSAASQLRGFADSQYAGGVDFYWSKWAAEARASYELLGVADSFWDLAGCFDMLPLVEEARLCRCGKPAIVWSAGSGLCEEHNAEQNERADRRAGFSDDPRESF